MAIIQHFPRGASGPTGIVAKTINFQAIAGGAFPGTSYDGVTAYPDAAFPPVDIRVRFAERFAGQSLSASGFYDVVTGSPTNPLTLVSGAAGQNFALIEFAALNNVIAPLGNAGFPSNNALGFGSLAFTFQQPQRAITMRAKGANSGTVRVRTYRADGSSVTDVNLTPADESVMTLYSNTTFDVVGVLLTHNDPGGMGFDDLTYEAYD